MKKLLLACSLLLSAAITQAQTDTTLQEFTGKYKFPDGSPVTEINIVIENGVLTASTAMGNSELKKTDNKDVFDIVAYSGTATFKRSDDGKIRNLRIQVQDIDMEGVREEPAKIVQIGDNTIMKKGLDRFSQRP